MLIQVAGLIYLIVSQNCESTFQVLSGESEVTFEAVQRALSDKAKVMIDVRSKEEFKAGRIPRTFNVPC